MNWSQKLIIVSGVAFIVMTFVTLFSQLSEWTSEIKLVKIFGTQGNMGSYDPSIEYGPKGVGFMAYTSLNRREKGTEPTISVYLASSKNGGKKWKYVKPLLEGRSGELTNSSNIEPFAIGNWRYEMPSLIYDPDDPGKEWKLFAYRYFWANNISLARKYSVITYKYSANPFKGWSSEVWLFGANKETPPYPHNTFVDLTLDQLSPKLKEFKYYADPGVLYKGGAILMSLTAYKEIKKPDSIILIASTDHGKSWSYLGVLMTAEDVSQLGKYDRMGGGSLIKEGDDVYFMVSLGSEKLQHQGTMVFGFDHLAKARLQRDEKGDLKMLNYIPLPEGEASEGFGGGQSAYHEENINGGMVMPLAEKENFKLWNTGQSPVKNK